MINKYSRIIIKRAVLAALENTVEIDFPVNIKKIVQSYSQCRLIPYSLHMQRYGLTYQEMLLFAGSADAFTDYNVDKNRYLIFYNDLDAVTVRSCRYRWNIAHELGHVLLRHHISSTKTRLFRNTLSQKEYKLFESEADYFASYILVPYAAIYQLNIESKDDIAKYCKISVTAAKYRFDDYKKWSLSSLFKDEYDHKIYSLYRNVIEKKFIYIVQFCTICHFSSIPYNYSYCPICGSGFLRQIGEGEKTMLYAGIDIGDKGKAKICPICQNEETNIEGEFCQICGTHLVNKCNRVFTTPDDELHEEPCCDNAKSLPGNARFCPYCGSPTTFGRDGTLLPWEKVLEETTLPLLNGGTK